MVSFKSSSGQTSDSSEFFVYLSFCSFSYPYNSEFQQRISRIEWDRMTHELSRLYYHRILYYGSIMILLYCGFMIGVLVHMAGFAIWVLPALACCFMSVRVHTKALTVIENYNTTLFRPRGIRVQYFYGGRYARTRLQIKLTDPENADAVNDTNFRESDAFINEDSLEPEENFQYASVEFDRSPVATSLGPGINSTDSTHPGVVQTRQLQNQGSTIQMLQNGARMNVVTPQSAHPGQPDIA